MRPTTVRKAILAAAGTALCLAAAAGLGSLATVAALLFNPVANLAHTEYDPVLGWVSRMGYRNPDYYGRGRGVGTNSRRFRGPGEVDDRRPAGVTRIVCLGDSFTFGHGLADGDAWPARLAGLGTRLETLNLGQVGYGIDQMYLWYARDAARLEHDAVIVAFVYEDFTRLARDFLNGYAKPRFRLEGNSLRLEREPLPRISRLATFAGRNAYVPGQLRSVALVRRLLAPEGETPADMRLSRDRLGAEGERRAREVLFAILEELYHLCAASGRRLAVVYLPTLWDILLGEGSDAFRLPLAADMGRRGLEFIDLTNDFRTLEGAEAQGLFRHEPGQPLSSIHYNAEGQAFVAGLIYRRFFSRDGR